MKKLLFVLPLLVLVACGGEKNEDKETREPVELKSDKEKLSYALGAKQAWDIVNSQDPNVSKLDFEQIAVGFKNGYAEGFDDSPANPCMQTIQNLFGGGTGATFDQSFAKDGSKCIGELTSGMMYMQLSELGQLDKVDKAMLVRGFEDGLQKVDTVMSQANKDKYLTQFNSDMQAVMMAKQQEKLAIYEGKWTEIKAMPGIRQLDKGICLETVKAGSGPSPKLNDDIEASYTLYDFDGNMIESSKNSPMGEKFQANLHLGAGGLIEGWVVGFQSMKKGGQYVLYVPAAAAYGDRPLKFEIELFDFGPAGSIKK